MAHGVARHVEHLGRQRAQFNSVALHHFAVKRGEAVGIGLGPDHLGGEAGQHLGQPLDVVGMVVGQPDLAQRPATAIKLCHNRGSFGYIDQRHGAAVMVAQQEGVIV